MFGFTTVQQSLSTHNNKMKAYLQDTWINMAINHHCKIQE